MMAARANGTHLWLAVACVALVVAALVLWNGRARAADLLAEGAVAPGFALPNQDGELVDSTTLAGKWFVLYFYPKDDTPGCTKEACAFRDRLGELRGLGVRVLGVSFDDVPSHKAFAEKYHLTFDLLSDPQGEVVGRYRAKSILPGVARRVSYLVDDRGVIRKVYPDVSPTEHAGEIIADVKALGGA